MKIISLNCSSCNAPGLSFIEGVARCTSCGNSFAKIGNEGDSQRIVSYRAFGKSNGKTRIPLKLDIAELIRSLETFLVADGEFYGVDQRLQEKDGRVVWTDQLVKKNYNELKVALGSIKEEPTFLTKFNGSKKKMLYLTEMFSIGVKDVDDENGMTVGESVIIEVNSREFIPQADSISLLISERFGVIPSVVLIEG